VWSSGDVQMLSAFKFTSTAICIGWKTRHERPPLHRKICKNISQPPRVVNCEKGHNWQGLPAGPSVFQIMLIVGIVERGSEIRGPTDWQLFCFRFSPAAFNWNLIMLQCNSVFLFDFRLLPFEPIITFIAYHLSAQFKWTLNKQLSPMINIWFAFLQ